MSDTIYVERYFRGNHLYYISMIQDGFLFEGYEIFGFYYQCVHNVKETRDSKETRSNFITQREGLARKFDKLLDSGDSEQAIERKFRQICK